MTNKILLERFIDLANSRKAEIIELQHVYLLKQIENEIVQERFKEVQRRVLLENIFYSVYDLDKSCDGTELHNGDRILSSDNDCFMSEEDIEVYLKKCAEENYKAGLTDSEGYYTEETNTENQLNDIKEKLIRLLVEILPEDFPNKKLLEDAVEFKSYQSYKTRETLFELVMKLR